MNILIAVDIKYLDPAKRMLMSLRDSNPGKHNVYLMHSMISDDDIACFKRFLSKKLDMELFPIKIDNNVLKGFPIIDRWGLEAYYRVIAQEYLPEDVDRIIWLDADIIVRKPIEEIYNSDFNGNYIKAVEDCDAKKQHDRLALPKQHKYFNSGIIVFDIQHIREYISIDDIRECVTKNREKLKLPDQDLLNILYQNKTMYIDSKYNNMPHPWDFSAHDFSDAAVIHYIIKTKPWHIKFPQKYDIYYLKYLPIYKRAALFILHRLYREWVKIRIAMDKRKK